LAHELGHIVMHKHVFEAFSFYSTSSWKEFESQVDPHDYDRLEFQGYSFGGLVLVPPRHLKEVFLSNLDFVIPDIEKAKAAGFRRSQYLEYAKSEIASKIAPVFEVSADVVLKRIGFDRLSRHMP